MDKETLRKLVDEAPKGKKTATTHSLFLLNAGMFVGMSSSKKTETAEYIAGKKTYNRELAKMIAVRGWLEEHGIHLPDEYPKS
jgi:hypothetical protein